MRRLIRFSVDDVLPSEVDVLRRFDMPRDATVAAALRAVLDDAAISMRRHAEPRGVVQEVSAAEFADVYRGDGHNAEASPLETIYPRADRLALFVGTIGDRISEEIQTSFRKGDPAQGTLLDAYASEAANRVAYALAAGFSDGRVLPYSPGYCGWHVSGQRRLFQAVQPADIGVTLGASCLMTPLKSVSGVLVDGDAAVHRFHPTYAFCDECATHECVTRMASVRR